MPEYPFDEHCNVEQADVAWSFGRGGVKGSETKLLKTHRDSSERHEVLQRPQGRPEQRSIGATVEEQKNKICYYH